jgi:hypothetical protein
MLERLSPPLAKPQRQLEPAVEPFERRFTVRKRGDVVLLPMLQVHRELVKRQDRLSSILAGELLPELTGSFDLAAALVEDRRRQERESPARP